MLRKTRRMQEVENRFGAPVEEVIRRLYLQEGLTIAELAKRLEVAQGTLGTWMVRLHITRRELVAEAARDAAKACCS